jgi:hypothetical protein
METSSKENALVANPVASVAVEQRPASGAEAKPKYKFSQPYSDPDEDTSNRGTYRSVAAGEIDVEGLIDHLTKDGLKNALGDLGETSGLSNLNKDELMARVGSKLHSAASSSTNAAKGINVSRMFDHMDRAGLKSALNDMGVTSGLSNLKKDELKARLRDEYSKARRRNKK